MKNFIKVGALALLGFTLQAAQYAPGPDGLVTTCALFTKGGIFKISALAKQQFKQIYGIDASEACNARTLKAVDDIKTYVGNPAFFSRGKFTSNAAAESFIKNFSSYGFLMGGNVFPLSYLSIAQAQLETALAGETTRAGSSVGTLRRIATALQQAEPTPSTTDYGLDPEPVVLAAINTLSAQISKDENDAKELLNSLKLKWDVATGSFLPDAQPLTVTDLLTGAVSLNQDVYQPGALKDVIQTTFALRIKGLALPQIDPTFLPLIGVAAGDTTLLEGASPFGPTLSPDFYSIIEGKLRTVISAMHDQITQTDTAVAAAEAAIPAPVSAASPVPAPADGKLATKVTNLFAYMNTHLATGGGLRTAVEAAFDPLAVSAGLPAPVAPAHVDANAAITAAETQIQQSAAQLTTIDTLIRTRAEINTTPHPTLLERTQSAVAAINGANNAIDTAAAVAPAVTVNPDTLANRITSLAALLRAGGSVGIDTYLTSLTAITQASLVGGVPTELAPLQPVIGTVRTALGYGMPGVAQEYDALADICTGLRAGNTYFRYMSATTTQDRVKTAINYLLGELYTSFMWLTSRQNLTGTVVNEVPDFKTLQGMTAQNVGAAAEARIKQLNGIIGTLSAQNATFRASGAGAGAEANANVITVMTDVANLGGILTQCDAVRAAATPADKLAALPAAVTQLADVLPRLTVTIPATDLPAANGIDLANKIRTALILRDPEIVAAATHAQQIAPHLTPCTGLVTHGALSSTHNLEDAVTAMADALSDLTAHITAAPAGNGHALATTIENHFTGIGQALGASGSMKNFNAHIMALNNNVLGGFIDVPAITGATPNPVGQAEANAIVLSNILQDLANAAGIKAGGAVITAPAAGTPLTQADKLAAGTLAADIRNGLKKGVSSTLEALFNDSAYQSGTLTLWPAITAGSLNTDGLHITGYTQTDITNPKAMGKKAQVLRNCLAITKAVVDELHLTGPYANFDALKAAIIREIDAKDAALAVPVAAPATPAAGAFDQNDIDAAVAQRQQEIAQQLMAAGSGSLRFNALPANLFTDLTVVQPDHNNLTAVANFYRDCAAGTAALKALGNVTPASGTFLSMRDLITQSVQAIEQQKTDLQAQVATLQAQVAATPAPAAAAGIPKAVIAAHNEAVRNLLQALKTLQQEAANDTALQGSSILTSLLTTAAQLSAEGQALFMANGNAGKIAIIAFTINQKSVTNPQATDLTKLTEIRPVGAK